MPPLAPAQMQPFVRRGGGIWEQWCAQTMPSKGFSQTHSTLSSETTQQCYRMILILCLGYAP